MNNDKILNDIAQIYRQIELSYDSEIIDLYNSIENQQLREIFSSLHEKYNIFFDMINQRISESYYYLHAQDSKAFSKIIELTFKLQNNLLNTEYEFKIDNKCEETIRYCSKFLSTHGSHIPEDFQIIDLYIKLPIFKLKSNIKLKQAQQYKLKFIGEGSYAQVFKYKDKQYNKNFAIKKAKKSLTRKELQRFKLEFEIMKNLSSPYIVEVYKYNSSKNEYVMEYIPHTLLEYIKKKNSILTIKQRINICNQIIHAFIYIHGKGYLHRDISLTNILIKEYEDVCIIKITDFGLVKLPNSDLTSYDSKIKGSLNDPQLYEIGFNNYNIQHEIYALTKVITYVLTGKKYLNTTKIKNVRIKNFIEAGTNPDFHKRYKNMDELIQNFHNIFINN